MRFELPTEGKLRAYGRLARGAVFLALCAALSLQAGFAKDVLKGKVEQHDGRVRLARPAMPKLPGAGDGSAGTQRSNARQSIDLESDGFTLNFKAEEPPPRGADKSASRDPLQGEAENKALIIAWEEWHKRVCGAIFEHWKVNGVLPGVAHARLRFTRDRHIDVEIQDINIDPAVHMILPVGARMSPEDLQDEYSWQIVESIRPLEGSSVLDFPKESKRQEVIMTPAFRGTRGPANFTWKKDDYEHVNNR